MYEIVDDKSSLKCRRRELVHPPQIFSQLIAFSCASVRSARFMAFKQDQNASIASGGDGKCSRRRWLTNMKCFHRIFSPEDQLIDAG